jgi:hypothetical protein
MPSPIDLSRIRADRRLQAMIDRLNEPKEAPAPDTLGWQPIDDVQGQTTRWRVDGGTAEIGFVPGEPTSAFLRYHGRLRVWHDTTPGDVAVMLETGFGRDPDRDTPIQPSRPSLRLL